VRTQVADRECPLQGEGVVRLYDGKPDRGYRVWRRPHSLQVKDLFCRFDKKKCRRIGAATKDYIFRSYQIG